MCACVDVYTYIEIDTCVYMCVYVCICAHTSWVCALNMASSAWTRLLCTCVHVCVYICIYIYIYVYVYMCIYGCMYICIYEHTNLCGALNSESSARMCLSCMCIYMHRYMYIYLH